MPLPEPNKDNEDEDEFIERCMSNDKVQDEFGEGTDQAYAVCQSQWDEAQESIEKQYLNGNATFKDLISGDQ
jgi:hypothetical protein